MKAIQIMATLATLAMLVVWTWRTVVNYLDRKAIDAIQRAAPDPGDEPAPADHPHWVDDF